MKKEIEQIKRHEGLRLKPYRCTSGKLTIGYGRNLEDSGISLSEANGMLIEDVCSVSIDLRARISWFERLNEARQGVLINMAFNLGAAGLLKFKKMLSSAELGDFESAADEMLDSRWAKQVGKRANELARQMRTGKYYFEVE